jgi:hypothetical protein
VLSELRDKEFGLHPALLNSTRYNQRVNTAFFDKHTGEFAIPGRTALVFVTPLDQGTLSH